MPKWHKYSYTAQIQERRSVMTVILTILLLVVVFSLVNAYLVSMFYVRSSTMEPTIGAGDCVLATPLYRKDTGAGPRISPLITARRGDLVLVGPAYPDSTPALLKPVNAISAFLTFQRFRPFGREYNTAEKPTIRRLVALPGDSVYMDNFVLHVKSAGSTHYLTEFEVSDTSYDLRQDPLPDNWTSKLPFSGSMPEITLGDTEFFVLCDNRKAASDSRVWGPVPASRIRGKVLLRYWPFSHFGIL